MSLFKKIIAIYPEISIADFGPRGTIVLQNDSDGKGEYIARWEHPTLPKPTAEQLA